MRRLTLAAVLFLLPTLARADVTAQQLARALSGYENPVTEARLKALGPGWDSAAEALLRDPATRPILRPRAIAALGFARTSSAAATLRQVLSTSGAATEGAQVIETREAIRSLVAVEGARALPELKRYLDHVAVVVRLSSIDGLATVGGAKARAALRERLVRESEAEVKDALSAALKRVGD